jgi:hypothetical protein
LPCAAIDSAGVTTLDLGDGRAANLDAGVAPGLHAFRGIAVPAIAGAESRDECDAAVDRDRLPVIAGEPAKRTVEPRRVEAADVRPGGHERFPQSARAERAEPVVDDVYMDAGPRALG